jgi:hypothetical protein
MVSMDHLSTSLGVVAVSIRQVSAGRSVKKPKWITAIEVNNTYPGDFWGKHGPGLVQRDVISNRNVKETP